MDNKKGLKIPVHLRVNMWLGLATEEKKFNQYAEGIFNVFAELVNIVILGLERSSLELGVNLKPFSLTVWEPGSRSREMGHHRSAEY